MASVFVGLLQLVIQMDSQALVGLNNLHIITTDANWSRWTLVPSKVHYNLDGFGHI